MEMNKRDIVLWFLNKTLGFYDRMGGIYIMPSDFHLINTFLTLYPELEEDYESCESNYEVMEKIVDPLVSYLVNEFDVECENDIGGRITKYY